MKKVFFIGFLSTGFLLSSCVSSKVYKDLEGKYSNVQQQKEQLAEQLRDFKSQIEQQKEEYASLKAQREQLQQDLDRTQSKLYKLEESFKALEANSTSALAENSKRNRELLAELERKETALKAENDRLENLKKDLAERSSRIEALEKIISAKDAKMNALKNSLSKALTNFEGKGLTVEQRNGKIYVSMENKLLFGSGSWSVASEGSQAVAQLGKVLAENQDISVLIEGHTDNVPYNGSGALIDNWDLSMKRATAIVHILEENKRIDPQNLTAAGRGEFAPVASNETGEGKAKNRRIEVILTPKLDEITKLLEDME